MTRFVLPAFPGAVRTYVATPITRAVLPNGVPSYRASSRLTAVNASVLSFSASTRPGISSRITRSVPWQKHWVK